MQPYLYAVIEKAKSSRKDHENEIFHLQEIWILFPAARKLERLLTIVKRKDEPFSPRSHPNYKKVAPPEEHQTGHRSRHINDPQVQHIEVVVFQEGHWKHSERYRQNETK